MPSALQLRCLTVMPNFSKLAASHSSSKKATRIFVKWRSGQSATVATGSSNGGFVAREAKAWLPSAWGWARGRPKERAYSVRLLKQSVREPDPYYSVQDGWVVRRLGPHCGRIELTEFPKRRDEHLILKDMGRETANLHLATPDQRINVLRDFSKRKPDWLVNAAQSMTRATKRDWESFKSSQ